MELKGASIKPLSKNLKREHKSCLVVLAIQSCLAQPHHNPPQQSQRCTIKKIFGPGTWSLSATPQAEQMVEHDRSKVPPLVAGPLVS